MTDNGEHPVVTEQEAPVSPRPVGIGEWDFGLALVYYVFLAGGTIVLGSVLFLSAGFKASAVMTELLLYLALPWVLSRYLDTGWNSWMRRPRLTLGTWAWMLCALLGLGVLASNIPVAVDKLYPMSEEYKEFFEIYLRADSGGDFALLFVIAAVIPGICEEITFRGLIQQGVRATYGPRVAITLTGILFAVIHLSIWNVVALASMGWFLGLVREKTGSIWPGAAAHVVNNGMALALISAAPPSENAWQYEFFPAWVNATAAAALAMGLVFFLRRMHASIPEIGES